MDYRRIYIHEDVATCNALMIMTTNKSNRWRAITDHASDDDESIGDDPITDDDIKDLDVIIRKVGSYVELKDILEKVLDALKELRMEVSILHSNKQKSIE